ncbi:MAG: hypothetical protein AAB692_00995 [Patescibacteria group bacterium]
MDRRLKGLIRWIRTTAAPAEELLVPVSGGSDSALCLWLCHQAYPGKTVGVHAGKKLRSAEWFDFLDCEILYTQVHGYPNEQEEMRWARFQRMSFFRNAWLVGSRNRTEDELGTYSLASRAATFLPLVGVWKSEVMELCRLGGVPKEITDSSLRADPDCGRPSEMAEIPFADVEKFLRRSAFGRQPISGLNQAQTDYLWGILRYNAFKKKLPLRGPRLV